MPVTHYLVTDSTAEEVERLTGLPGHNTPYGVIVEKPKPFSLEVELEKFDRVLHPTRPRCTCGKFVVMHSANCPVGWAVS